MIDAVLIRAPHSYELKDFAPLTKRSDLRLRFVESAADWGDPELVLLSGTTDVAADFDTLQALGLVELIQAHAHAAKALFGICGGLQLMGQRLLDPHHHKYPFNEKIMLGLLELDTQFEAELLMARLYHVSSPFGVMLSGFETHRGMSSGREPVLFRRADGSPLGWGHDKMMGTYLHRCFHSAPFVDALIHWVKA